MLACDKSFERYLLDNLQRLDIGEEPDLHAKLLVTPAYIDLNSHTIDRSAPRPL